ncbi:DUF229 domain-containing protein [Prauserella endophytica]|uniref:DUF229 domain-containing protein n=1 Tax=Prauserella endophytica TaxID=1592324 RepID=A0ABY2S7R4_9PSEU|nr:DUF229 domain-containing protein [Prauserella endophytica]
MGSTETNNWTLWVRVRTVRCVVKPNLLIVMSDQHVPHASGAYGDTVVRTPTLDSLAARGTTFDAAYCNSPICVPSRAAMATGRYVHQTGNYDNASPYTGTEAASWGHRVEAAGIPLVTIGKLHYRGVADDTGFSDQRLPLHVRGGTGDLFHCLRDAQPPAPQLRGAVVGTARGESDYTRQDRSVAEAAVAWLTDEAPRDRAWAAKVSLVTPHYPFTVPGEYLDLYADIEPPEPLRSDPADWDRHPAVDFYRRSCGLDLPLTAEETRRSLRHYFGLVSFMDAQLGMVLRALVATGQAENTIVLYVSDHGELMGTDGTWFKGTMNERSVRIPMILAGPGVAEGERCGTPVSLVDVFPTVLDALGIASAKADADLPGRSLLELARRGTDPRRTVFSEFHSANSASGGFMVRYGSWKYEYHVGFPERLFDLAADPDELHDRAADPAAADALERGRKELLAICDPVAVDAEVRADQRRRIAEYGGIEAVLAKPLMTHSPTGA